MESIDDIVDRYCDRVTEDKSDGKGLGRRFSDFLDLDSGYTLKEMEPIMLPELPEFKPDPQQKKPDIFQKPDESLSPKKQAAQLISLLWDPEKSVRRSAAKELGKMGDPVAVNGLIKKLEDESFFVQREAAVALGKIGDARAIEPMLKRMQTFDDMYFKNAMMRIAAGLTKNEDRHYCTDCFHRAAEVELNNPYINPCRHYICRGCGSNSYLHSGVQKVSLILDHSGAKTFQQEESLMKVYWFGVKKPLDFDEIIISDATEVEVEELVMKLHNDMDKKRRKALDSIPVFYAQQLKLSTAKLNLLAGTFQAPQVIG